MPYPKIEKTVSQFLTIHEYNRLLDHCSKQAVTFIGLRNHIIIMMLGLLGLTGSLISMNIYDVMLSQAFVSQHVLAHSQKNTMKYAYLNPDHYAVNIKMHPFMNF